jgi:hypothetical protein
MKNTPAARVARRRSGDNRVARYPERLSTYFFLLTSFFLLSPSSFAGSFQPRVHIPAIVQVEGDTVRLSDLLPPDASAELGEICARISLGKPPLPASQRVIWKRQIEQQLSEFPAVLEQLEIPERLIITCKQRRLSPAEIWTAIETFMAGEGVSVPLAQTCLTKSAAGGTTSRAKATNPERQVCAAGGLNLQAPVYVTKLDPGLEVKRVEPDRVQRKIRFLLWASNEPQVSPFYVTVEKMSGRAARTSSQYQPTGANRSPTESPLDPASGGDLADFSAWSSGKSPQGTVATAGFRAQAASPRVVLVTAGKPARLVVETPTLRMTALVTPLESGVRGQLIRVRNQDTRRVFEAEVAGVDQLRAELAGE